MSKSYPFYLYPTCTLNINNKIQTNKFDSNCPSFDWRSSSFSLLVNNCSTLAIIVCTFRWHICTSALPSHKQFVKNWMRRRLVKVRLEFSARLLSCHELCKLHHIGSNSYKITNFFLPFAVNHWWAKDFRNNQHKHVAQRSLLDWLVVFSLQGKVAQFKRSWELFVLQRTQFKVTQFVILANNNQNKAICSFLFH